MGAEDGGFTTGEIYDYVVEGVAVGGTTTVVIELVTDIPENATLRKYSLTTGWRAFDTTGGNAIESKAGSVCNNGDPDWMMLTNANDLTAGDNCLRLTLVDGGTNDDDGVANGIIVDPVGPSILGSGLFGGCVYNPNAAARFDLPLLLLGLLGGYYLLRRKRNKLAA